MRRTVHSAPRDVKIRQARHLFPPLQQPYLKGVSLAENISRCRLCAPRFSATATHHSPRPVVWFDAAAPILIAGQAPGLQVHQIGKPFADRSGDRLRRWLGIESDIFYDRSRIAIVPMAFCFPGYDSQGHDLPPPSVCAQTWRALAMEQIAPKMTILVGGYAQRWHLGAKNVTQTVANWRDFAPQYWPLPHPSWRNTGWLRRNPWFEQELVPRLQDQIARILREET